jgi:hypothetical protein
MLRIHLLRHWFNPSDRAAGEALDLPLAGREPTELYRDRVRPTVALLRPISFVAPGS